MLKKKKKKRSEFCQTIRQNRENNSEKTIAAKTYYMTVLHKEKLGIKIAKNMKCWYSTRKIVALSKMA